jgi:hypothetical protein
VRARSSVESKTRGGEDEDVPSFALEGSIRTMSMATDLPISSSAKGDT